MRGALGHIRLIGGNQSLFRRVWRVCWEFPCRMHGFSLIYVKVDMRMFEGFLLRAMEWLRLCCSGLLALGVSGVFA